jgi:prepilin-type N-terminal cleavage/methylation domain-containing protein
MKYMGSEKNNVEYCSGFTLIELVIVIGVITVLAGGLLIVLNPLAQLGKARDAQRKNDLHQIKLLLEQYYNDHQRYPPIAASKCFAPNTLPNCYDFSYPKSTAWIPELVPGYTQKLPLDPINNNNFPWDLPDSSPRYSYFYGDVSADGKHYDLGARLENPNDPQRCGLRDYMYALGFFPTHVCVAFGGSGSNQVYALDQ